MDQGCRAPGTVTSESTCEMVIKTVLIKVKVRVGPSQGEALQALGGPPSWPRTWRLDTF